MARSTSMPTSPTSTGQTEFLCLGVSSCHWSPFCPHMWQARNAGELSSPGAIPSQWPDPSSLIHLTGSLWGASSTLSPRVPNKIKLLLPTVETHSVTLPCWLSSLPWLTATSLISASWVHFPNKLLALKSLPWGLLLGKLRLRLPHPYRGFGCSAHLPGWRGNTPMPSASQRLWASCGHYESV